MIFRNVSGTDLDLPTLGLHVATGDEVEVTGEPAKSLLENPLLERTDKPKPRTDPEEK